MTNSNREQQHREWLLFQYSDALDDENWEQVLHILSLAERDPELDRMIAELDDALLRDNQSMMMFSNTYSNNNNHQHIKNEEHIMTVFPVTSGTAIPNTYPKQQAQPRRFTLPISLTTMAAVMALILFGVLAVTLFNQPDSPNLSATTIPEITVAQTQENADLFSRYIEEIWQNGNVAILPELVSVDHVLRGADSDETVGVDDLREVVNAFHDLFSDVSIEIIDTSAEGNSLSATLSIVLSLSGGVIPQDMDVFGFTGTITVTIVDNRISETVFDIDADEIMITALDIGLPMIGDLIQESFEGLDLSGLDTIILDPSLMDITINCDELITPRFNDVESPYSEALNDSEAGYFSFTNISGAMELDSLDDDSLNLIEATTDHPDGLLVNVDGMSVIANQHCNNPLPSNTNVLLSPSIPLDLELFNTSGSFIADLTALQVENLTINTISGFTSVTLPANTEASIHVENVSGELELTIPESALIDELYMGLTAGSITLDVAENVGFEAHTSIISGEYSLSIPEATGIQINLSGLPSVAVNDFVELPEDFSMVEDGIWQSDNFETADAQVILNVDLISGQVIITH